ncbi:ras-related protein Rab-34-like [Anthonomus grandis grandis]|uniref:ras-related protein Rab-34-like n=1 Tax=Anthonomus grandis grandis TaxID=2921223 RepID=UPI002165AE24|nr:ras-related protein Rab-34-like [Anthonomus grandis grandis]
MEEHIPEENIINKYPSPYNIDGTPYLNVDFSEKIRRKCLSNVKNNGEWLKMSKVVIIGDVSVGKTCLVNRYCRKFFESSYKSTIGVDFEVQRYQILGVPYVLQIWDTAGQERFKSIAQSYYRGAHVVILAFDLTNCETLSNCKKWLLEAMNANIGTDPFVFLVGSKRDLLSEISYKNLRGNALKIAKDIGAEYWCVSSKTGKNVNKLFRRIACLSFEEVMTKGYEGKRGKTVLGEKLLGFEGDKFLIEQRKVSCCNQ